MDMLSRLHCRWICYPGFIVVEIIILKQTCLVHDFLLFSLLLNDPNCIFISNKTFVSEFLTVLHFNQNTKT